MQKIEKNVTLNALTFAANLNRKKFYEREGQNLMIFLFAFQKKILKKITTNFLTSVKKCQISAPNCICEDVDEL